MNSLEIYRSIFEKDPEACFLIKDGGVIDCNRPGLDLFGFSRDDLLGKPLHFFSPSHQPDGSESATVVSRHLAQAFDGGNLDFGWYFRKSGGEEISTRVALIPLENLDEQVMLARVKEMPPGAPDSDGFLSPGYHAEQFRKMDSLSLMAGGLAHEFNNYLLAILGNADLLQRDIAAGKSGGELLSEIRKAAGRAADLCNQLLAFSGKGQASFQTVDLSLTVQEMVQMIKVAISRRIALHLELDQDLPLIAGDITQIHQVIMNLVVNASEAMAGQTGVITLGTGLAPCGREKPEECIMARETGDTPLVFLEVRDSGEGMDEEIRRRIFDPFFSTKTRGRGLGLASVLGTIRSHQGSLCVHSTPGEGTVIRACFPRADLTRLEDQAVPIEQVAALGRGTVLIVDDEEFLRVLCSRMLRRLGYTVLLAEGGPEALEIYRSAKGRIDGVILDLVMPVMDGVEVLERLLNMDPNARVIMTSGYHEKEIAARFTGRGIAGFIQKPYVMSDLGKILGSIIPLKEAPDPEA
jgi:PAS domain S-box-containing protein